MASIKAMQNSKGETTSWKITVSIGYDINNKKIIKTTTFKNPDNLKGKKLEKALQEFAIRFEADVKNGVLMNGSKIKLIDFVSRWRTEYAEMHLQAKTLESYNDELNNKILPFLGHFKLADIKTHNVNALLVSLTKDGARKDGKPGGYSSASIHRTKNVLSSVLQIAVKWEIIEKNPCDNADTPGTKAESKLKFFEPEQIQLFLDFIDKPYFIKTCGHTRIDDTGKEYKVADYFSRREFTVQMKALFTLAAYEGMRKGEIVALKWDDIDFVSKTISVNKSSAIVGGKQIIKGTKTASSNRVIPMLDVVAKKLLTWQNKQREHVSEVGGYWQEQGFVFTQDNGNMISYYTPYNEFEDAIKYYNASCTEDTLKLPIIPFHGLRHSCATLLFYLGIDIKTIQSILGHSSASTSMNIYGHTFHKSCQEAAQKVDEFLTRKQA